MHSQVSGLGRQVPGSGVQHQVQVRDLYPRPYPTTRTWCPMAETWDLRWFICPG